MYVVFGLHLASKIFPALSDGPEWIIRQIGVQMVEHYLDDFIVLGTPADLTCQRDLYVLISTCNKLEVLFGGTSYKASALIQCSLDWRLTQSLATSFTIKEATPLVNDVTGVDGLQGRPTKVHVTQIT